MYTVQTSKSPENLAAILDLRYRILRAPWLQSADSATDDREGDSVNAFISEDNGRVIACGRLQKNDGGMGQIRFMAVEEKYQGKGLGKLIVEFLEDKSRQMGLLYIQLQARENAVDFYKKMGYETIERTFLLWGQIQHFLMQKKIQ